MPSVADCIENARKFIGDFDAKKYREKLSKWGDFVYHDTMKMYGSIVQYYLNQLKERKEKLNDIFIY